MLNKIYLALLAAAVLVMAFFTYYSWTWLQSIGSPQSVVEGYSYHSDLGWYFLWSSTVVLLVIGNAILWTYRNAWAMWATLVYFAVFVLLKYFWLDQNYLAYKKSFGLANGSFDIGPVFAVVLVIVAAGIVFFDQFLVSRLAAKMFPKPAAAEVAVEETPASEPVE